MRSRDWNLIMMLFIAWFIMGMPLSIAVIVLSILWLTKKEASKKEAKVLIGTLIFGIIEFVFSLIAVIQSISKLQ